MNLRLFYFDVARWPWPLKVRILWSTFKVPFSMGKRHFQEALLHIKLFLFLLFSGFSGYGIYTWLRHYQAIYA